MAFIIIQLRLTLRSVVKEGIRSKKLGERERNDYGYDNDNGYDNDYYYYLSTTIHDKHNPSQKPTTLLNMHFTLFSTYVC